MLLVGSTILMCRHAIIMYLSTIIMCLSAITMYGIESIFFNHAMLPVNSAIVEDWLQLFLATLNLFLYLDREGLLVGQGLLEDHTMFVDHNPKGLVR
jgi:hypothetical protein